MAFEIMVLNSENNIIYEVPFLSNSMLNLWSQKAERLNLPIIKGFYEEAFNEGVCLEKEELEQLNEELHILEFFFEKEGYSKESIEMPDGSIRRSIFDIIEKLKVCIRLAMDKSGTLIIS